MHPEFPPIAFIAAASLLLPLPWHWRAVNVATLSIVFWLFFTNIIYGVDAIVWGNNVNLVIPVWCDITNNFLIGANFALPAACLCICIHLERVASLRQARSSMLDKKRRRIFEFIMCFVLPIIFIALHYVVQGHRFDIIEEYGCRPATYFSIPAILIVWVPPIFMGLLCLVFATLAIMHFMRRRVTFAQHLGNSGSALTTSRYLRLIMMALVEMVWTLFVTSYNLWFTAENVPLRPWKSWAFVHAHFLQVGRFPTILTPVSTANNFYALWWTIPISSFIFVGFFAFGKDAVDEYKACFRWFKKLFARRTAYGENLEDVGSLPVFRTSVKDLPISFPVPIPSSKSSPTFHSYQISMDKFDFDSQLGTSFGDLSPATMSIDERCFHPASPSTASTPSTPDSPPAPLTPPPPRTRVMYNVDGRPPSPSSPRAFKYPSL